MPLAHGNEHIGLFCANIFRFQRILCYELAWKVIARKKKSYYISETTQMALVDKEN